jgi:hypothetical protein
MLYFLVFVGTFIAYPPTLLWYPGDTKLDSLHNAKNMTTANNTARELILYEGSKLTEGHSTSAFWRLASRNKPIPKPEYCFSVVTSTRSLDLAAESVEDAQDWKLAMKLVLDIFVENSKIEIETKGKLECDFVIILVRNLLKDRNLIGMREWGMPALRIEPALNINVNSQLPLPPSRNQQNRNDVAPPLPPPSQAQSQSRHTVRSTTPDTLSSRSKKEELKRQLFSSVYNDDLEGLKAVLAQGVPVNLMEPVTSDTPLMIACRQGNAAAVKLCLKYGAKNDPHPEFGSTALHVCVEANQLGACIALLNAAAAQHADTIVTNLTDAKGQTVLHIAAANSKNGNNSAIVELLLRHGADPNRADDTGLTPIHVVAGLATAARVVCTDIICVWRRIVGVGSSGCVANLLDHGGDASIDAEDQDKNTPLHHAASGGLFSTLKMLALWFKGVCV